ncbi:ABC transporter permease [Streptomyces sp. NPDC055078]
MKSAPGRSVPGLLAALVLCAVGGLAVAGPWLAPYGPDAMVGPPYTAPGAVDGAWLGTDQLGRDVLSRALHGGRSVVLTGLLTTALSCLLGAVWGITAALQATRRRWADALLSRPLDAIAALPPILLLLVLLAAAPGRPAVVLAVVVAGLPLTARMLRAAALQMVQRAHVEAAVARGERLPWLVGREVLPLVAGPLLADAGLRFVQAVYLIVAAGFLGLGTGDSDWGLMITESLPGAALQPWALAVPIALVATLATAVNVFSDESAKRLRTVVA